MLVVKGLDPRCSNGDHLRSRKNGRQSENFYEVINEIQLLRISQRYRLVVEILKSYTNVGMASFLNTGLHSIFYLVIGTFGQASGRIICCKTP